MGWRRNLCSKYLNLFSWRTQAGLGFWEQTPRNSRGVLSWSSRRSCDASETRAVVEQHIQNNPGLVLRNIYLKKKKNADIVDDASHSKRSLITFVLGQ